MKKNAPSENISYTSWDILGGVQPDPEKVKDRRLEHRGTEACSGNAASRRAPSPATQEPLKTGSVLLRDAHMATDVRNPSV